MTNFTFFAKPKVRRSSAGWISASEIHIYTKIVSWLSQTSTRNKEFNLLSERISRLVRLNGFNFTFNYLKECLRIVTCYLAGTPDKLSRSKVRVRLDRHGLPVIIPWSLRQDLSLSLEQANVTRATLTLLAIFRVFPTKVVPDLSSITEEFNGLSRSLDLGSIPKRFTRRFRIGFSKCRGFISESAGPNTRRATWGCALDAIALIHNPKHALVVLLVLFRTRSWIYILSLILIWILGIPLFIGQYFHLSPRSVLGKLSIVYDQAGKARVVAITNWWIQLCLLPLHESIFRFLSSLETDGTFNQSKPLDRLLSIESNEKFYCYDLSAATDRLPLDVQIDILNQISGKREGRIWKELLDITWKYRDTEVKYSVGQPMGAYSSWAMLALTHHILVQVAASRAGIKEFDSYAVLGDDIVIRHSSVANEYLLIMKALGVSINLNKSVVSTDLVEFAKRLRTVTHDVSPIGPGNILATCRRPIMSATLFLELDQRGIISSPDAFKSYLRTFPFKCKRISIALAAEGVRGRLLSLRQLDVETLSWIAGVELIDPAGFVWGLREHAISMSLDNAHKAVLSARKEESYFYRNAIRISASRTLMQDLFGVLTLFASPSFWLYLESVIRSSVLSERFYASLACLSVGDSDTIINLLFKSDLPHVSVRWDRIKARRFVSKVRTFAARTLESTINDFYRSRGLALKANFSKIHKGL